MKRKDVLTRLSLAGVDVSIEKCAILGIRGYFKQTMGDPNKNDRGIYDDAIFVISEKYFTAYQANTDPSIYRPGTAVLQPGVYDCIRHMHHGKYPALQLVIDTVLRDGKKVPERGHHSINIHHGGVGTWSEGCQTLPPETWPDFQRLTYDLLAAYKKQTIKYVLIENA